MKILIVSTYRAPTKNNGGNGLGRHVYDFLRLFKMKEDQVDIFCHPSSEIYLDGVEKHNYTNPLDDLEKIYNKFKSEKYDLILDNCHHKVLSYKYSKENLPIVNFIHDTECGYQPPNILIGNEYQRLHYPNGIVTKTGIIFDDFEVEIDKDDYYCFVGKIEKRKGVDLAVEVQKKTGKKVVFIGPYCAWEPDMVHILKDQEWLGEITDNKKLKQIIGKSKGLLYLSRLDAGGLAIWEASALGTPTYVIKGTGTEHNVIDKVTGFVCDNTDQVCDLIKKDASSKLDPLVIRNKSGKNWDLKNNFNKNIYNIFLETSKGKRW